MIGLAHAAMACNSIQTANNGETPMTHCHNSSAAARHAHELGMLDARDEEIERIQNSLLDNMPEWAKDVAAGDCPICKIEVSRVYGWYEERQEDMDMLYVINFDNKYLKVGRTFEIETRLRHLKIQSNINNLEILHLYNDIHSKIYPLEQIIHKRLKSLGFWKNVGWTTECFELEALPYVYEILEGLNE